MVIEHITSNAPFPKHTEHRWSSFVITMTWLLPLQRVLQETWSAQLFGHLNARDGEFNRDAVTKAVNSTWFWCYLRMCAAVESTLAGVSAWAESCPCHAFSREREAKKGRWRYQEMTRRFKKLLGPLADDDWSNTWNHCPMSGKRAVELACGHLRTICEDMFAKSMAAILEFCQGLADREFQSVTNGFSEAKSTLLALILLKIQFWLTIPWKLAGMFHWNSSLAAESARECLDQWERQPVDAHRHRVSGDVLSPGGRWRHQVQQLAQGVPLLKLSVPFIIRCAELGFMPVVERLMEQSHAFTQQRLRIGKKKAKRRHRVAWIRSHARD